MERAVYSVLSLVTVGYGLQDGAERGGGRRNIRRLSLLPQGAQPRGTAQRNCQVHIFSTFFSTKKKQKCIYTFTWLWVLLALSPRATTADPMPLPPGRKVPNQQPCLQEHW